MKLSKSKILAILEPLSLIRKDSDAERNLTQTQVRICARYVQSIGVKILEPSDPGHTLRKRSYRWHPGPHLTGSLQVEWEYFPGDTCLRIPHFLIDFLGGSNPLELPLRKATQK